MNFLFPRFDAVDHRLTDVVLRWSYQAAAPFTSISEFALLALWKTCYRLEPIVPRLRRLRERSVLSVYLGAALPQSGLRFQIAALRNDSQYRTAGAGIDVGYAPAPDEAAGDWAILSEWFERQPRTRLHMQMYLKVTSCTPLKDRTVLEVGCGQGDGAAFLARVRSPARYVGVDLHRTQIGLCQQRFSSLKGLAFQRADAQALPFVSGVFDVVLNVESSHSYPLFGCFVAEVFRVLKPGGSFCFADLCKPAAGETCERRLRRQFEQAGFRVTCHEDITRNAFLSIDELRRAAGGTLWDEFESLRHLFRGRELEYHWFVLTRPDRPSTLSAAPKETGRTQMRRAQAWPSAGTPSSASSRPISVRTVKGFCRKGICSFIP